MKSMHLSTSTLIKGFVLSIAYIGTARLGLSLSSVSEFATLIWFPTGVSFAALFLWGRHFWPVLLVASLITNLLTGATLFPAIIMATGNTLEAVIGVYLFTKFVGPDSRLERVRDVTLFVLYGALLSTMVSATLGVGALFLSGFVNPSTMIETWGTWWFGNILSNLVVAPILIIWFGVSPDTISPGKRIEGIILGTIIIMLSILIFTDLPSASISRFLRPHQIFIILIWATLRFGQKANVVLTFSVAAVALTCTILGTGPYQTGSMNENILNLQLFIAAVALSGLYFGALGREKEHALRMRTDFISIASHELRTPITGLNLSLDVLKEFEKSNPSPEVNNSIQALDRQSKKLGTLVHSLLNVAQIESGKLVLEKKETDLSSLVMDVSMGLRDLLDRTSCKLIMNVQPKVKSFCSAYGIEQVLTNLLMNSMKYGAGKEVRVSLTTSGNLVRLSVKDSGKGISRENHDKIFERYQRVDNQDGKGLGLGLYISKLIIEAHRGSIKVESEPGNGATFIVEFPV